MGQKATEIFSQLAEWIAKQHVYFVATAPLVADGFVNCSPKGMDSLRIIDSKSLTVPSPTDRVLQASAVGHA